MEEIQREAIATANSDKINKGLEYWLNCQSESKKPAAKMHNKIYREVESQTPHKKSHIYEEDDFERKPSYADEVLKAELNRLKAQQLEREYLSNYLDQ